MDGRLNEDDFMDEGKCLKNSAYKNSIDCLSNHVKLVNRNRKLSNRNDDLFTTNNTFSNGNNDSFTTNNNISNRNDNLFTANNTLSNGNDNSFIMSNPLSNQNDKITDNNDESSNSDFQVTISEGQFQFGKLRLVVNDIYRYIERYDSSLVRPSAVSIVLNYYYNRFFKRQVGERLIIIDQSVVEGIYRLKEIPTILNLNYHALKRGAKDKLIVFPIYTGNVKDTFSDLNWSLLFYLGKEDAFGYVDSYRFSNLPKTKILLPKLRKIFFNDPIESSKRQPIKAFPCQQITRKFSSGVFMSTFLMTLFNLFESGKLSVADNSNHVFYARPEKQLIELYRAIIMEKLSDFFETNI